MRSSKVNNSFFKSYCKKIFGHGYKEPNVEFTNNWYGGTDIADEKIIFVNSIEDPWRYASMITTEPW